MMKTITKILTMLLVSTLFCMISCEKDDGDGDPGINEDLIGKWEWISYTLDGETEAHLHDCNSKKDYLEFRKDNTVKSFEYDSDCREGTDGTIKYSIDGNKITLINAGDNNQKLVATFTITGDRNGLTIQYDSNNSDRFRRMSN